MYRIIIFLPLSIIFSSQLSVIKIADVPAKVLYLTQPNNDNSRLFIVNQKGQIHIINNGKLLTENFLDISDRVHNSFVPGSEEGLLGLAFHPQYLSNGFFYVNYVNKSGFSIVSRFEVTTNLNIANPNSEKIILKLKQPFGNHNGGHLIFGPHDGMLYIGFGDGGKYGDPYEHGQNTNTWLGSILRIDIDNGDPYSVPLDNPFINNPDKKPEIWCFGLRNPWRFAFDKITNDLIIGDVGQNLWEEINWSSWEDSKGANYGWNIMEGDHCYNPNINCSKEGLIKPIHEYPNNANYIKILVGMDESDATGCSITGGYVYRGKKINSLKGLYIFGDYCTGRIWSLKSEKNGVTTSTNISNILKKNSKETPLFISSFGEDNNGELYIVDYLGAIYKFVYN